MKYTFIKDYKVSSNKSEQTFERSILTDYKGQAETVFEVLIAVILLSFVLVVGSYAMSSLSDTKCSKQIDISLAEFSRTIEETASSSLASKFYLFDLPNCFGPSATTTLYEHENPQLCASRCPGSMGRCYLLRYDNEKDPISPTRYQCVNISPLTIMNDSKVCNDAPEKFTKKDSEKIAEVLDQRALVFKRGQYVIKSVSLETPIVCVYEKERSN